VERDFRAYRYQWARNYQMLLSLLRHGIVFELDDIETTLLFQSDSSALKTNTSTSYPHAVFTSWATAGTILAMTSAAYSATGSATVLDQSDDVESILSGPYEEQPLLDSAAEIWTQPKDFFGPRSVSTSMRNEKLDSLSLSAIMSNVFLSGFDGSITASTYAVISSEFNAANTASWLTTSYLITSTAFQPLYGRFSDIFGRRVVWVVELRGILSC
jgi:hypothetical protein